MVDKDLSGILSNMPIAKARALALALLAALDDAVPASSGPTVKELFDIYMTRHGSRARSARRIQQMFDNHLGDFAPRSAASVTPGEVAELHNRLGTDIGQATANRVLEVLRAAYNKCIRWGLFEGSNPCLIVSPYSLQSRDRYLSSKAEMTRFMAALETMRSRTFRNFVKTALFTAARVSNVQAMRWSELDFDLKIWRIPMTKSGKPVLVPLIPEAIAAIEAQRGLHEIWVFPGNGKTGHLVNPARSWQRLCAKAGVKDLRMHDLRRTMGSWEANTGASLQIIQKTLGHSSIRATHIYARLQLEPVREAMQRAASAMLKR